ncbi:MAG: bifunctional (p)ppGpp synthetase/guanosine-3',5'-bis(diphosphate) 3'-pyrophosphohydrolase [Acutalibacteraceae bacterium]|jgi:guanosine-3',5'-bis(diphosphate) 3'-pyrophosphohydrolase|nr:bifunctional (p)ppGpp synthetase/guanosine-3',5'-bis(diphosphate) 3'-pyrophosphohydrolase [Acutalibacteraceae bacterium]CDA20589.1 putative GTP diphosphokinase [Ruminococcus sp. CAG:488]
MSEANEKNKLTATMNEATAEQDEKKDFVPENPDELYGKLIKLVRENMTENDVSLVEKAYFIAKKAHEGQFRFSGEPYIIHPVSVAIILYNLGMDGESMAAALLHDVVEDTDMTKENIQEEFGEDVANLVEGVTKLGKVPIFTKEEQQAENVRKMLMAMSQDIRVIIIKLADRIHNMRTLSFMRPDKRREKAQETLEIYAPIAHRLGIRGVKEELEDLAISYLDPVAYKEIRDRLEQQQSKRKEYLDSIQKKISERIKLVVPNASISGRIKSVHGIYRKMYMQGKSFDEIYDIYAVRIIVDDVIDCYNCLGIIHDMFKSIPGRFKDYISTPKANMYQSLHTTVIGDEGIPFEVQIRTWEMHRTAEYGVAAHWKYKLGMSGRQKFEEKFSWIRQLLESQNVSENPQDIVNTIKTDLVQEEVFVFTPKGTVINLPAGATVVDFAYAIHSAVGNRMVGAKVDGRIVPIDYVVKTGEIVEIITSSQQNKGPSRDWLKFVKTSGARNKIRSWFKKERREENILEGKMEVEREFKRNFIRLNDQQFDKFILEVAQRQRFNSADDFFAAIGYGGVSINKMMPHIKDEYVKEFKQTEPAEEDVIKITKPSQKKRAKSQDGVVIEGIDNCLIKLSKCCSPVPGDKIIGFITRGHGVSIHKRDCTNVPKVIELADEPDRWIPAGWDSSVKEDFTATVSMTCLDRVGLMADVSKMIADMRVMIYGINTKSKKDGRASLELTIGVNGIEHLNGVMAKLRKINGVLDVERSNS